MRHLHCIKREATPKATGQFHCFIVLPTCILSLYRVRAESHGLCRNKRLLRQGEEEGWVIHNGQPQKKQTESPSQGLISQGPTKLSLHSIKAYLIPSLIFLWSKLAVKFQREQPRSNKIHLTILCGVSLKRKLVRTISRSLKIASLISQGS
jgi:hypothetical protein